MQSCIARVNSFAPAPLKQHQPHVDSEFNARSAASLQGLSVAAPAFAPAFAQAPAAAPQQSSIARSAVEAVPASEQKKSSTRCLYGARCLYAPRGCQFEHTAAELQLFALFPDAEVRKKGLKLKPCASGAVCNRGARCTFAHSLAEAVCASCKQMGHFTDSCPNPNAASGASGGHSGGGPDG